jgi:predicted  nucleic acid-binding Zn-ribbon protein
MEEKKYEAGRVEISSAEYRDLVTEAVEARRDASEIRSEKWKLESEKSKLSKELEEANKKIAELENVLATLQASVPPANKYFGWHQPMSAYNESNKTEEN